MADPRRGRPLRARNAIALVAAITVHVGLAVFLIQGLDQRGAVDLPAAPAFEVQLASMPRRGHSAAENWTAARALVTGSGVSSPQRPPGLSPIPGTDDGPARASGEATVRLGEALRNSLVGCQLAGVVLVDRSVLERCADRLGARAWEAPTINGIARSKRADYDAVAYQQEEDRAFFHVPTIGHQYAQGAGGIAGGPASTEIFGHNVGDPSPPKDPLLKRQSKSLGPPIPDH